MNELPVWVVTMIGKLTLENQLLQGRVAELEEKLKEVPDDKS
jgi:hypothetical protein